MLSLYTMIRHSLIMQQQICDFQKTSTPKTDSLNLVDVANLFSAPFYDHLNALSISI